MNSFLTLFDMIGVLAHRRYQMAERNFASLGLSHSEARLLSILNQEGGQATQDTLSAQMFIDRSNAGRALKRLEAVGYIVRVRGQTDRRSNRVELTDSGRAILADVAKLRKKIAQHFFGDVPEADVARIVALLKPALTEDEFRMRGKAPGTNRA